MLVRLLLLASLAVLALAGSGCHGFHLRSVAVAVDAGPPPPPVIHHHVTVHRRVSHHRPVYRHYHHHSYSYHHGHCGY